MTGWPLWGWRHEPVERLELLRDSLALAYNLKHRTTIEEAMAELRANDYGEDRFP